MHRLCLLSVGLLLPAAIWAHAGDGVPMAQSKKTIEVPAWAQNPYDDSVQLPPRLDPDRPYLPRHRGLQPEGGGPSNGAGPGGPDLSGRPTLLRHLEGEDDTPSTEDPSSDPFEDYPDEYPDAPEEDLPECPNAFWEPCLEDDDIEEVMRQCCEDEDLSDGCMSLCRPGTPLEEFVAIVNEGSCSWEETGVIMDCAAYEQDATDCCDDMGVMDDGCHTSIVSYRNEQPEDRDYFFQVPAVSLQDCINQCWTNHFCFSLKFDVTQNMPCWYSYHSAYNCSTKSLLESHPESDSPTVIECLRCPIVKRWRPDEWLLDTRRKLQWLVRNERGGRQVCGGFCNPGSDFPEEISAELFRCIGEPFDMITQCYRAQFPADALSKKKRLRRK